MKKSKLFCKFLSVVSAGLVACSGSMASALSSEKIVKLCFGEINSYGIKTVSRYYMKFGRDEKDLLDNLDVEKYSEFINSIDSDEAKKSFRDQYDSDEKLKDSADFLFFINLINNVSSGPAGKLMDRLISMRNKSEYKNDKDVAQAFDANFETKMHDIFNEFEKNHAKKA